MQLVGVVLVLVGSQKPDRPVIRARFASYVWTLQNSTDSLFVETTTFTAVDDGIGAVATNQTIKDGRTAGSIGYYSKPSPTDADGFPIIVADGDGAPGIWNLDPFFDRHVCYIFPPEIPGDPTHTTVTFPLALELVYGVALDWYNSSTQAGTKTIHGRECELWLYAEQGGDHERVVYCVERSTGALLSANRTAWEYDGAHGRNITVESLNVLYNVDVDPPPSLFAVPPFNQCADLRALAGPSTGAGSTNAAEDNLQQLEKEEKDDKDDEEEINDSKRLNRINKDIAAAGGGWMAGKNRRHGIVTVSDARKATASGGVRFQQQRTNHFSQHLDSSSTTPTRTPTFPPTLTPTGSKRNAPANSFDHSIPPSNFDSRTAWPSCNSIQTPRDQGRCGSCWAFSAAETLADRLCVAAAQAGNSTKYANLTLSVEYLMDCDVLDNGCGGGLLDDAWQFMVQKGLPTEKCIPYQEFNGPEPQPIPCYAIQKCLPGNAREHAPLHQQQQQQSQQPQPFQLYKAQSAYPVGTVAGDVVGMQQEILAHGPIQVAFQVFSDFHSYAGGTYFRTKSASGPDGGHAVKIIGWGVDVNGADYWTVANSWGANWGSKGFFNIRRGTNECGIESTPTGGRV